MREGRGAAQLLTVGESLGPLRERGVFARLRIDLLEVGEGRAQPFRLTGALVAALVWGVVLGLGAAFPQLLGGDEGGSSERPSTWLWLIGLTLLTTPLQAAGEEYLFRGWVMQWVGSFVPSRIAAVAGVRATSCRTTVVSMSPRAPAPKIAANSR